MNLWRSLVLAAGVLLAGCQGLIGGDLLARVPLAADAAGGFQPVHLALQPDMGTVTIGFQADLAWGARTEGGSWNVYRAILRRGGQDLKSREFMVNSPDNADRMVKSPAPNAYRTALMVVEVTTDAEYELRIEAMAPARVTLRSPQLDIYAARQSRMP